MMVKDVIAVLQADPWIWNFLCVNAGILIHTVKKCKEGNISIGDYWRAYKGRGTVAVLSIYGSYIALMLTNSGAGTGEFLAIGYMIDSMVNRAPEPKEVTELKEEVVELRSMKERRQQPDRENYALDG